MARVDVEEVAGERPQPVVAELELQHLLVKRHHVGDALEVHHDVAHAERAGAEAGDVAAGLERIGRDRGAMEELEPVAGRIVGDDEVLARAARRRARASRGRPWCPSAPAAPRARRGRRRPPPPSRRSRCPARRRRRPPAAACGRPCGTPSTSGSCRSAAGRGNSRRSWPNPPGSWRGPRHIPRLVRSWPVPKLVASCGPV